MAGLPPDGEYLVQSEGDECFIVHAASGNELLRFKLDGNSVARAQKDIYMSTELDAEQKCFAHFWSGYFYGCKATGFPVALGLPLR
jgi:hypothetical protein